MNITDETWEELRRLAVEAMNNAYAPYSGYPVGAAALTEDGRWFSGCNVENAAYSVVLCAECGMISDVVRAGHPKIVAVGAVNGNGEAVVPCGRCRQLISEHVTPDAQIAMPQGIMPFNQAFPYSFGQDDLNEVETSTFKEN
ncbi:cytidine deaminase [Arcanobacterium haemolyticum]|nr:cytidine deaminase [Arcanobacterium haemolyticum]